LLVSDGASEAMNENPYDRAFYDALRDGSARSARTVWPIVRELLAPRAPTSIIDIGCGDGMWLAEAMRALDTQDITGVDGDHVRSAGLLRIPEQRFVPCDLASGAGTLGMKVRERFDLAISLEVAEHLPRHAADEFVAAIVQFAPIVLFSAAIPGQGGENHVNEEWPEAWVQRFAANGFQAIDEIRFRIWKDDQVEFWYKQNLLLFASAEGLEGRPGLASLARETARRGVPGLVHPTLLQNYGGELESLKKAQAARSSRPRLWSRVVDRVLGAARRDEAT
jgi:hypothetical protein